MANDFHANPWYIDTVPATYAPPTGSKVFLKEIRWENYAAGDTLTITDADGGTLVSETISGGNSNFQVMRFGPFGWVNGFSCTAVGAAGNITVTITKS
jgi:hypothetical protein